MEKATEKIIEPPEQNPCFVESRRLTGPNLYFKSTGAVLEVLTDSIGALAKDEAAVQRWRELVSRCYTALGWPVDVDTCIAREHAAGTLLAIAAPSDQLFSATEINEWAWETASGIFAPSAFGAENKFKPPFDRVHQFGDLQNDISDISDISIAAAFFAQRAVQEKNPALAALVDTAIEKSLPYFVDDQAFSIGAGEGSCTWPLIDLPALENVNWHALHNIPTVLVTGSNGKTTTVRLLAAMLSAMMPPKQTDGKPRIVGCSSTEGIMIGAEQIESGDYSGPAGARAVLRHPLSEAAVLETARGGILRRGLAVTRADVAIITNVSADHFGEYGIDSINDLADVKLVVAKSLDKTGTLILNADDQVLMARTIARTNHIQKNLQCKIALFSLNHNNPHLVQARAENGLTCGVINGELLLSQNGRISSLGKVADMPLTIGGVAEYNTANIAAASLAAMVLGASVPTVMQVLSRFGKRHRDNPGRLERWNVSGFKVLIDYAHNPDGLEKLLRVSQSLQHGGRLGLLLGQAGNRDDDAIVSLAQVAAHFSPNCIVIKELATMLRGRELGEVPLLLRNGLVRAGFAVDNTTFLADEIVAAQHLLQWAKAGDVVVLPIHQKAARQAVIAMLETMAVEPE